MYSKYYIYILYFLTISSFAFTVTDDANHKIQFTKPFTRIISLSPDLTDDMIAIAAQAKLVGAIADRSYPQIANNVTNVGSYQGLDMERIIKLKPDLIITWDKNFSKQLSILKKFAIAVYVSNPQHLQDIAYTIKNLGVLTGNIKQANAITASYQQQLQQLKITHQQATPIHVFYQIGDSRFTLNKDSWINDVIEICGGKNIFANMATKVATIDMEAIIKAQPDVIISSSDNDKWQVHYQHWSQMKAVRVKNLFTISSDNLERPSLNLLKGAQQMCQFLTKARLALPKNN